MPEEVPGLRTLFTVFGRIGILSFGGPAAQIALMHKELVEDRRWLTEEQYLSALSFCMLLPGPEAMQLATFAGWRLRGIVGGLIGGLLFVLPGAAVIAALALVYATIGTVPFVEALFLGIQATVVVIVLQALLRVSQRALTRRDLWIVAGLSFSAIFFFSLPFPLIILAAGLYGFATSQGTKAPPPKLGRLRTAETVLVWLAIWLTPIGFLWLIGSNLLFEIAIFFSKLAIVTFGGAYAVLAYMTQQVVAHHGWITTAEMIDGLGLAETTPGPLILVTQFVAMLAGFKAAGVGLALLAGLVALWSTFVPCFLWIFAGAPYVDWISARPRLSGALRAITAAVVGVILNLTVWFGAHVFFSEVGERQTGPLRFIVPQFDSFEPQVALLACLAAIGLIWRQWPLPAVLGICAAAGVLVGTV